MPVCNGTTDRGHPGHLTKIREARVRDRIVELVGGRVGPRPLALLLVGGDQIGYGVVLADDPAGIRLFRGIARPRRLAGQDLLEPFVFGGRQMMQQPGQRALRRNQPRLSVRHRQVRDLADCDAAVEVQPRLEHLALRCGPGRHGADNSSHTATVPAVDHRPANGRR